MSTTGASGQGAAAIEDIFPLTGLQQGIHAEYRLSLEGGAGRDAAPAYNEQFACTVVGVLLPERFEQAWNALALRHPMLRAAFTELPAKGVVQVVLKSRPVSFSFEDLTGLVDARDLCAARAAADRATPFDLARDSLLRVRLLRLGPDRFRLIFTVHHLIFDAWCAPIVFEEVMALYARALGVPAALPDPPRTRFGDVVRGQAQRRGAANAAFWREYLRDVDGMSPLPFVNHEAAPGDYDRVSREIDPALVAAMGELAGRLSIPVSSMLHAMWGWVLARLQDRDEVLISVVRANRPAEFPDIERVIGMFITTGLLRVHVARAETIAALLQRVHHDLQQTAVWSAASLAEMLSAGSIGSGQIDHTMVGRNELLSGGQTAELDFPNAGVTLSEFHFASWDHYDFQIGFSLGREACFEAKFRHGRFAESDVGAILDLLLAAVEIAVRTPEAKPATVPLISQARLAAATLTGPQGAGQAPLPVALHALLAREEQRVVCRDDGGALSASQLIHAVHATASMLAENHGVKAGDSVAIVVEPGNEVLVGMLAAWHLGAAFVPIGADWPTERTAFVVSDSRAAVLLAPNYWHMGVACPCPRLRVRLSAPGRPPVQPAARVPEIAYIIYTSGSSGRPKGVAVGMEALSNYCHHALARLGLLTTDAALQVSSPAFDLGYTTLFPLLLAGGTIHWTGPTTLVDPLGVIETMAARRVTLLKCTPSYLRLILSTPEPRTLATLTAWRLLILGGEGFDRRDLALLAHYCPWLRVVNHYGPTETTIGCAMMDLGEIREAGTVGRQFIGTPVANSRAAIVDRHGGPLPRGVEGELVVAGAALARGYIDGSAGGFFLHEGERAYRTGDRARITAAGVLEYLGRADGMVKIRGFRVNVLETEMAIRRLPLVDDVMVMVDDQGDSHGAGLLAFVQSAAGELQPADIRRGLAPRLLPAQIPARILMVSRLLINANGKADRQAMLGQARQRPPRPTAGSLPQGQTEQRLAAIWQRVLKVEAVARTDDFFSLGGHSLRALQVAAEVRSEFEAHLSLHTFFAYPTLADLARRIEQGPRRESALITLRRHHLGGRLLCLPPALGVATPYKEMIDLLDLDLGVDGINCPALLDGQLPPTLPGMVAGMIALLPAAGLEYQVLIGWSFGATLAVEMAHQLAEKGRTVKLLLLDGGPRPSGQEGRPPAFAGLAALASRRYWSQVIAILRRTMTPEQLTFLETLARHNVALWERYTPTFCLNSDILAVEAKGPEAISPDTGLKRLRSLTRGRVELLATAGDHYSMFHPQHVEHWLGPVRRFIGEG